MRAPSLLLVIRRSPELITPSVPTPLEFAPSTAVPIEQDAAMADEFPLPEVPQSSMARVLADARAAYDQVLQSKTDRQAEAQATRDQHAADRLQVAGEIAQERLEVASERQRMEAEAAQELIETVERDRAYLRKRREHEAPEFEALCREIFADEDPCWEPDSRDDRAGVDVEKAI